MALGGYGLICEMAGWKEEATRYAAIARDDARKWLDVINFRTDYLPLKE